MMIQPARVLPSNASPLRDGDNVYQASRILQEHSGNRQQSDLSLVDGYGQKHPSSAVTENIYELSQLQHCQQRQQQLYHPQPQHRQIWRYGQARAGHRPPPPEEEANIRFAAERLYSRFRKSDHYVKYRNRQTKDDKGKGDQKWPDHLEKAFFRALVQWPPMGRRKHFWKEKQRGRNELIADCIEELTGEARSRKQVSSHIQVLKPFVENDPYIMKWLAKEDMGAHTGRYHGNAAYTSGRRMSHYPVTAPPQGLQENARHIPRTDPLTLRKAKNNLNIFEPVDFQMFVQRSYKVSKEHEEVERMHTYTQSITAPLEQDLHLDDMQTFHRDFPLLSAMQTQRRLDCNILDAEASLAFPTETWKAKDGSPIPGVELGIYFLCTSAHLPSTPAVPTTRDRAYQVIVNNNFYEHGVCVKDHSGPSEARFEPSERGGGVETRIKFGSTFWARTLGRLAGRLLDANRNHRDEVASYLSNINAVQEIIACSENGSERLLVIHWKFRLSTSIKGRASWRRLVLPTEFSQCPAKVDGERVDSMYDYTQACIPVTSHSQHVPAQLALQSPFEYESSTGSTLSSATWHTSTSNGSAFGQQNDGADFSVEHAFDFNAANLNFTYDTSLNFDNFDSSAFNFDTAVEDLAADPALQDYSQPWYESYASAFGEQPQAIGTTNSFTAQPELDAHAAAYDGYSGHYDQEPYLGNQDTQAYGGAGQEMIKEEDALAALADASFMASALNSKQNLI